MICVWRMKALFAVLTLSKFVDCLAIFFAETALKPGTRVHFDFPTVRLSELDIPMFTYTTQTLIRIKLLFLFSGYPVQFIIGM